MTQPVRLISLLTIILGWSLFSGSRASAQDADGARYFVEMFGYATALNRPAFSHSYASFYRIDAAGQAVRVDISWIPQDSYMTGPGDLRMPAFGEVPGQNLTVLATMARARAAVPERQIESFGPFAITPEFFRIQLAQSRRLFSGAVAYSGLDVLSGGNAANCVHALSYGCGDFPQGLARGPDASWEILRFCASKGFIDLQPRPEGRIDLSRARRIGCAPSNTFDEFPGTDCSESQQ